jgi:hypothetical protein
MAAAFVSDDDDDMVVVEAYVRAAILLDPNTIMSRIQWRLPNTSLSLSCDSESINTGIPSSDCLLRLTVNDVATLCCSCNDCFFGFGLAQRNAWWLRRLSREEND